MPLLPRIAWLGWTLLSVSLGASCKAPRPRAERVELSLFAASSLTEAFEALAQSFEANHPNVEVALTFSGSQVLRLQLEQGAPADVFASADQAHARALSEAGLMSNGETFAHNELVVIVPPDNPASIESFADLGRARRLVIGTDNVPVGRYARQVLRRAEARFGKGFADGLRRRVASEESNVRLVRAKVALGVADAAIVYRTDATSTDAVALVPIPAELNARASYPIGVLSHSRHPVEARRFVDFVLSPAGQGILEDHGFASVLE